MRSQSGLEGAFGRQIVSVVGAVCVVASIVLLSPGVRIARAEDRSPQPAVVPTTPTSPPASPQAPKASPFVKAEDLEQARRPGVSGVETAPGVVVLNTRGYNYGPPPTPIAPEALAQE